MASAPDATVIIVTHESANVLPRCLTAIDHAAGRRTFEVIVIDNDSTDASAVIAQRYGARVISASTNLGFAAANNRAIAETTGINVVLINPDAFADSGSIEALLDRLDRTPIAGIVGGVLRYPSGLHQPSAGAFPSLRGRLWVALGLHRAPLLRRLGIGLLADPSSYKRARRVDWVTAAYCAARRDVGPLPEKTFMYGEDVLWAWVARARGYQVWIEPRAQAIHLLGESRRRSGTTAIEQRQRVQFDDLWFGSRSYSALWAARLIAILHGAVRWNAAVLLRALGFDGHDTAPWAVLMRTALTTRSE